jgi:transposase
MENITLIGIDLAKRYSHISAQNHAGKIVYRRKVATPELLNEVETLSGKFKIAMEACGSSNHWGRIFQEKGYEVKLIPPQYVKAYRTKQKNDYNDAQATCEASKRADIHPVPVKDLDRQTAQHIIRVRQRLLKDRVELVNHLHGVLAEYGYNSPKGYKRLIKYVREELFLKGALNRESARLISADLEELEIKQLRIDKITKEIKDIVKKDPELSRMLSIPGVGEITALSIYGQFKS